MRVVDEEGNEVAPGEYGEFVTSGPQVVAGYWNKPDETEHALPGRNLHTGDIGFMDPDGWYYVVDRRGKKCAQEGHYAVRLKNAGFLTMVLFGMTGPQRCICCSWLM